MKIEVYANGKLLATKEKPNYYTNPMYKAIIDVFKEKWNEMIYWCNSDKENASRIAYQCYGEIEAVICILERITGRFKSLYKTMKCPAWDYLMSH